MPISSICDRSTITCTSSTAVDTIPETFTDYTDESDYVFTCGFFSVDNEAATDVNWFKYGESDALLSVTGEQTIGSVSYANGSSSSTLTIRNVTDIDEAYYYCQMTYDNGVADAAVVESDKAGLLSKLS
eukprot:sb/3475313/